MEDIEQRLKEATENCLKAHGEWKDEQKDSSKRESLMDSVHELRKVAARLEIMVAISERDQMASKPIPIPAHKSQKKGSPEDKGGNEGNRSEGASSGGRSGGGGGQRRRRTASSGGGGNAKS